MELTSFILPRTVSQFKLVGIRPLYLSKSNESDNHDMSSDSNDEANLVKKSVDDKVDEKPAQIVDPFWKDIASGTNTQELISMGMQSFGDTSTFESGKTKKSGQRVLSAHSFIRIQSQQHPDGKLCVPTVIGKYRLRLRHNRRNVGAPLVDSSTSIEVWEEVLGESIHRPPEGWDDLVDGGAEVQGRWAWGDEKKSDTEEGVGKRIPFSHHENRFMLTMKLATICLVSWVLVVVTGLGAINIPIFIGRNFFKLLYVSNDHMHDPFALAMGCVLLVPLLNVLAILVANANGGNGVIKFYGWVSSFRKPGKGNKLVTLVTTVACWSIFAPFFTGLLYILCFVADSQWWETMMLTSNFACPVKPWAVGFILFHVWALLCYVGVLRIEFWTNIFARVNPDQDANRDGPAVIEANDPQRRNEDETKTIELSTQWQGENGRLSSFVKSIIPVISNWEWDKVDHKIFLSDLFYPIITRLLVTLCVPITIVVPSRILLFSIYAQEIDSIPVLFVGDVKTGLLFMLIFYLSLFSVLMVQLTIAFEVPLRQWFEVMHQAARDDRYLIGKKLMNYQP